MPAIPPAFKSLEEVLAHHASISEYMDAFSHAVPWLKEQDLTRKISGMQFFIKKHVLDHFNLEEQQLFPQLLRFAPGSEIERLVRELRTEHVSLLQQAGKLNEMLLQVDRGNGSEAMLQANQLFREFITKLQKHAVKEDNFFLPLQAASSRKG